MDGVRDARGLARSGQAFSAAIHRRRHGDLHDECGHGGGAAIFRQRTNRLLRGCRHDWPRADFFRGPDGGGNVSQDCEKSRRTKTNRRAALHAPAHRWPVCNSHRTGHLGAGFTVADGVRRVVSDRHTVSAVVYRRHGAAGPGGGVGEQHSGPLQIQERVPATGRAGHLCRLTVLRWASNRGADFRWLQCRRAHQHGGIDRHG